MTREDFEAFMNRSVELLKRFGDRLPQGDIPVEPYRHGQMTPCQYCDYSSVCRIDTRTHSGEHSSHLEHLPKRKHPHLTRHETYCSQQQAIQARGNVLVVAGASTGKTHPGRPMSQPDHR